MEYEEVYLHRDCPWIMYRVFRDVTQIMQKQAPKNMENEMGTGTIFVFIGI